MDNKRKADTRELAPPAWMNSISQQKSAPHLVPDSAPHLTPDSAPHLTPVSAPYWTSDSAPHSTSTESGVSMAVIERNNPPY